MAFRGSRQGQFNHYDRRPYGWGFQYGDSSQDQFNYLARIPIPYGRPIIRSPSVAPFRNPQLMIRCEICDIVAYSQKCMEAHKNGKKHQFMLSKKASNEQESRQKSTCHVENVSSQATISKHKNFQQNDIGVSSKIPADGSEEKPKDNTKGDGHGLKRKIGGDMNNGIKRPMVSSKPDASALSNSTESLVQKPALASPPGPATSVMAPTHVGGSSMKLKFQHVSASQTQVSEGKEHHEIQNPTAEKNDQRQSISEKLHDQTAYDVSTMTGDLRRGLNRKIREDTVGKVKKMNNGIKKPAKSSKPDVGALSNSTESLVHKPALTPPPRPGSPIMTSTHIGGSSSKLPFQYVSASHTQESEGKEHHEIQNPTAEKNDQPQSISEELHDQTASNVSTKTGDLRRGLNRMIREDTVGKVKKMNNGIKKPVKSSKPDVGALSNSTESLVHKPALTPPPRPAAPIMTSTLKGGSSSKLPFQHVSASQTQVSEGKEHHEIQNPTAEKNDQPQSISEELHDQTASNVSTKTGDLRRGLNRMIREDTVGKVKKMNNGIKKPVKSSKPDVGALSNSTESLVHKPALTPPPRPAAPIITSTLKGGSSSKLPFQHVSASQTQVSEGKEHHEIQSPTAEKNDQRQSISEELHDQTASNVSNKTGDLRRGLNRMIREDTVGKVKKMNNGIKKPVKSSKPDVGALSNSTESLVHKPALTPPSKLPFQHVSASHTQVSEGKEHHEVQNPTAEKNDQPQSISEELHDQTASIVSTMTGDLRRGLKRKIREDTVGKVKKMNNGRKRPMVSSKPDASALSNSAKYLVQKPALASPPGPASSVMAPTRVGGSSLKQKFQHVSASQTQVPEGKEHHEIQNPTAEKNDQPQSISEKLHDQTVSDVSTMTGDLRRGLKRKIREDTVGKVKKMNNGRKRPMVSSKPDARALSNSTESLVLKPALTPPPGPASPIMTSTHIGGSSLKLPFQHVSASQTQVSEGKEHHEIQNPTAEKNVQPQSSSEELHDQTTTDANTMIEDMNSETAALAITASPKGPMASQLHAPPPAPGSSFEPEKQLVLQTEVLKGKEPHEIQNHNVEIIDLPESISVELHDPAVSNINTQTENMKSDSSAIVIAGPMASQVFIPPQAMGSSFEPQIETNIKDGSLKAEAKADVLPTEKVMVCLKCGDEGFSDTFVFCDKCQVYALHRYCLDGPVVFLDDVTWFCEDCEPQCILLPSKTSDSGNSAKDASQGKSDLTNYEESSVEDNNDQQQNNTTKRKVSDCHSAANHAQSQSINNCEEEEKFMEDCPSVPTVHDACPIMEPIWRGSWCFSNQSSDTITGLFAHLSTIACPNVLEETKLFPEVLSVNLLPRSAVWPECFFESGPNDESLALYFFPNERAERAYDNLVDDMISHDLGIKAMIKNAELLVFPSTVLPIQHRRFQAKYYLWGIFRAKQHVMSS